MTHYTDPKMFMSYSSSLHDRKNEQNHKKIDQIKKFGKNYRLLFFYRETAVASASVYCIIKAFKERYEWTAIPISVHDDFPKQFAKNGQTAPTLPMLFAMNPHTHQYIPLTQGLISLDTLESSVILNLKDRAQPNRAQWDLLLSTLAHIASPPQHQDALPDTNSNQHKDTSASDFQNNASALSTPSQHPSRPLKNQTSHAKDHHNTKREAHDEEPMWA